MTIHIQQEPTTGIWMFDAAGKFSPDNFQEEYSNIVQNYAGTSTIKILVDLQLADLLMDEINLIKSLIEFMTRETPNDQPVYVAFVIKYDQSNITADYIKTDPHLRVKTYHSWSRASASLESE